MEVTISDGQIAAVPLPDAWSTRLDPCRSSLAEHIAYRRFLRWASSSRRCSDFVGASSRTLPRGTPVPHRPQSDGVAEGSKKKWTLSRKLRMVALRRGALQGWSGHNAISRVCETARRSRRRQTAQVARFLFRLVPPHAHFWNRLSERRQDDCQKRGVRYLRCWRGVLNDNNMLVRRRRGSGLILCFPHVGVWWRASTLLSSHEAANTLSVHRSIWTVAFRCVYMAKRQLCRLQNKGI